MVRCKSVIVTDKDMLNLSNSTVLPSPKPKSGFVKNMCKFYSQTDTRLLQRSKSEVEIGPETHEMVELDSQRLSPSAGSVRSQDSGFSDSEGHQSRKSSPVCDTNEVAQNIERFKIILYRLELKT